MLQNTTTAEEVTITHIFISFCKFCLHTQNRFARKRSNKTKNAAQFFMPEDFDGESKYIHLILLAKNIFKFKNVWKTLSLRQSNSHLFYIFSILLITLQNILACKKISFLSTGVRLFLYFFATKMYCCKQKITVASVNKRVTFEKTG